MKYPENVTIVESITPFETKPLVWDGDLIEGYFVRNDGTVFHYARECSKWKINGRNYTYINFNGKGRTLRIDYMVAYTFLGMHSDAIRLIHINEDLTDDRLDNLMWYRKCDVAKQYRDYAIIESDGSIIEEWRPCVTEYNRDLGYEVSNLGLIRDSCHKLIQIHDSHGYRVFYYMDPSKGNVTRVKAVHRAVAEAFIPNPHSYTLINHLDGNKYNDIVSNLEWADNGMNAEHAYLQKLNDRNEYNDKQIHTVCKLLVEHVPHVHIAMMTGVDRKTVSDIYRGRRWSNISRNYIMPERKWTPETKETISNMIISGMKGKEIYSELRIEYNQSAISLYERLRRELKAAGKIK